nr:site-specific DNA-methyltransferase [uncultured Halomonas sp.]
MNITDAQLRELVLSQVPDDGSTIGNTKLLRQLSNQGVKADRTDYDRVRDALVVEGVLGKGRGKGGSVYLANASGANDAGPDKQTLAQSIHEPIDATATSNGQYGSYQHADEATLRPDVGLQDQFHHVREPKTYRYDSSLAPELAWDENSEREYAEWLLNLVAEAGEKGEGAVFGEPPRWQGTGDVFRSSRECVARLRSLTRPFLNWAGKAERQRVSVPTVPLFVHERHSTRAILERLQSYKAAGQSLDLFGDPEVDIADRLDAYEHTGPWTNRMILGDSLQVMNSLLEYEGLGGQVQMIYIDPPYGVKFGSNFQPFVRKRDMSDKHGKDEWMIREPEMVKAYRDTWELGLHSYLSYLRDRLLLSKELLTESGSIFVQISDENLPHVREVLDEIFTPQNFVVTIPVKKTGSQKGNLLQSVNDYLIWYTKNIDRAENYCKSLYEPAPVTPELVEDGFSKIEFEDGSTLSLTELEKREKKERGHYRKNPHLALEEFPGARLFKADPSTSGNPGKSQAKTYNYKGRTFDPGIAKGLGWKHSAVKEGGESGMDRLASAGRLYIGRDQLAFKRYHNDFGYRALTNWWDGIGGPSNPLYAVQTNNKVLERCILMATEPGDIVLDPTCGSGTTAYVAEQWGRRWITCDTSRVPLALARQRLLTASFPWLELKEPKHGPASGFIYKRKKSRKGSEVGGLVPRTTAASIANNEEPAMVTLVDRPEENKKVTRVCGPFTVEATIQSATTLNELPVEGTSKTPHPLENPRAYLDRMIEVLRRAHNLQLPGNQSLALDNVCALGDCESLHAEARTKSEQRVAVAFGPEDGAIHSQFVIEAAREAYFLKYDQLYLFGFAIQAKAHELVHDRTKLRILVTYVHVTPDVVMADLLKTRHTDQIFSVTGLPDVAFKWAGESDGGEPLYRVEVLGLDIFRPDTLETESVAAENLPCWMLDTDYNGLVFCASQVFFPRTSAWDNLRKSLRAEFDDSMWGHLAGTKSKPFVLGEQRRIAIKVIDERGNELMAVRSADEVKQ